MIDDDSCYRAVRARDGRFDGQFFTAVTSTGIYCRPSCPARTPFRANVRFYPSAAAAQQAGFRSCKRCRPDAAPGSPEWNTRGDVAARAVRLIGDGFLDRGGVDDLAAHLGYSARQLQRLLNQELGAGALALARAQRARTARVLLEANALPISSVCFAAGFSSLRQFNDTMRAIYALTPSEIRGAAVAKAPSAPASVTLRLALRQPIALDEITNSLAAELVSGVEALEGSTYRRVLDLPHELGIIELDLDSEAATRGWILARLRLGDWRDLTTAVSRCRRLLDLDVDPIAVGEVLGEDPLLAPLIARQPGRRIVGATDPGELALSLVLGRHLGAQAGAQAAEALSACFGAPLREPFGRVRSSFAAASVLAGASVHDLPVAESLGKTLVLLAEELTSGRIALDPGADRDEAECTLAQVDGVGTSIAAEVRQRALGDPNARVATDADLEQALARLGRSVDRARLAEHAAKWRPFGAYAERHLLAESQAAERRATKKGGGPHVRVSQSAH